MDVAHQHLARQRDVVAEKLAAPVQDGQALDAARRQERQTVRQALPDAAAELCTPDAVQSAERSFAEREAAEQSASEAEPGAAESREPAAAQKP